MIKVEGLTKAFTPEKGLFDLNFEVKKVKFLDILGQTVLGNQQQYVT